MDRILEVEPLGGLANRMRVINSAYWLATDLQRKLNVTWTPSKGLNSKFSDLFIIPHDFTVTEHRPTIFQQYNLYKIHFLLKSLNFNKSIKLLKEKTLDQDKYSNKELAKYRRIFITSVHQFYGPDRQFYAFEPIDYLKQRIDEVIGKFNKKTIGVHIRRTDNRLSIEKSSTDKFITIMNNYLSNDPETNFFLSTDNKSEEDKLIKLFGSKIVSTKKELSRNSIQGIRDALVDLYSLGNTKKILGSYYSSFSEVAAKINNIPLEIVI